jgi:hypothetical protein
MESQIGLDLSNQPYPIQAPETEGINQHVFTGDPPIPGRERYHEHQLILACSRTIVDAETVERIRDLIGQSLDWPYLIRTASRNGVMPLVCLNLISICPSLLPASVLMDCREFWRDHAQHNLHQTAELLRVLRLLDSHNIRALPLKGPSLAAYAYHNLSLRQFCDLDIFVPRRNIRQSVNLLISNGFTLSSSPSWLQRLPTPASRKKDYGLTSKDGSIRIELHWRLSGPHFDLPVNLEGLWDRLETVPLAGYPARSLPLDDLLLYLTMHGSRHGWERLLFVCDIAEILSAYPERVNWPELLEKASVLGSRRTLLLGLCLAKDLLDATLPANILEEIRSDSIVKELASQVSLCIFRSDETSPDISYWLSYHLKAKERFREKVRLRLHYAIRYSHLAFTPNAKDHAVLRLPWYLSFAYYLIRVFRLAKKHLASERKLG